MLEMLKALLAHLQVREEGQDLTEYALLVALIAIIVVLVVMVLAELVAVRIFNWLGAPR